MSGEAPTTILDAAGPVEWLNEMPGRWRVEARATHVVVSIVGGTAMLTPHEAHLLEGAISTAKALVQHAMCRAEAARAMQPPTAPGGAGE